MIFYGNEASYHYGVSSALGTKHSAAPYFISLPCKTLGSEIERYNLWGIVDEDDTKHRFSAFHASAQFRL